MDHAAFRRNIKYYAIASSELWLKGHSDRPSANLPNQGNTARKYSSIRLGYGKSIAASAPVEFPSSTIRHLRMH